VAVDDGLDTGTTRGGEAAYQLLSLYALDGQERSWGRAGRHDPLPKQRSTETANGSAPSPEGQR
jgi:hypothetical protein